MVNLDGELRLSKGKKAALSLALLQTVTRMLQPHNREAVLITCLVIELVGSVSVNNHLCRVSLEPVLHT